jgi:hypothetical protein
MLVHMNKVVSNEDCRQRLTELATEVQRSGDSIGVQPVAGNPRYQLVAAAALDPDRVRSCVRLGPDKFRRYFGDVRWHAFVDDIPFGIEMRGELVAVFQRCPEVRAPVSDAFRAEYARRQGNATSDLNRRVAALEAAVAALSARLGGSDASLRAKSPPLPGKSPPLPGKSPPLRAKSPPSRPKGP